MNILHTETLSNWGGQQNKVIKEILVAGELGHNAYLLCSPDSSIARKAKELGITTFEYPMTQWNYFKSIPFVIQLMRALKIDVLITHSSSDSWMGGLAGRITSQNVVTVRERHNLFTIEGWPSKWLHRKAFHHIMAVSDAVKDYLVNGVKVPRENVILMPSVINVKRFHDATTASSIRSELGIPEDAKVFGIFCMMRVKKGIFDFLEIMKKILLSSENTYAVMGGDKTPKRVERFETQLKEHGVDTKYVKWTGFREDAANVLKGYDVFVFPSHAEGCPNSVLEAMACSLPIVAYDIRPMSDLVQNGINGYTVPFQDMDAMAERIRTLLDDKDKCAQFGRAGYAYVSEHYDEPVLKQHMDAMLKAVCHE